MDERATPPHDDPQRPPPAMSARKRRLAGPLPPPRAERPSPAWPAGEPYAARWVPVAEPPPSTPAERIALGARRYGFPLAALGVAATLGALVWAGRSEPVASEPGPLPPELRGLPGPGAFSAAAPLPNSLVVETSPSGALVYQNERPLGPTPLLGPGVPAGQDAVALRVEMNGYAPLNTVVGVWRPGQPVFVALARLPEAPLPEAEPAPPERVREPRAPRAPAVAVATQPSRTAPRARPEVPERAAPGRDASERATSERVASASPRPLSAPERRADAVAEAPVLAPGTLSVRVRPWGSIYVDGELRERGTDVVFTTALAAGRRRVRAVHPTLGTWERDVYIRPGERQTVVVDFNGAPGGG